MECLLAYSYLSACGFCSMHEYNSYLDKMFLETPENKVLLDLEECSDDDNRAITQLISYFEDEAHTFDAKKFGKVLFKNLIKIYNSNTFEIVEFGKKIYEMWSMLPDFLKYEKPFYTLSYADDALSFGDERQARKLYENTFSIFND